MGGSRLNRNDYVFLSVILVTHPKSYIEIRDVDRRYFGGKPSKWRCRRVLSWKILEFYSVGGARSKNSIFRVFREPIDYPAHSLQKTVLPQTNGTDGKPRLRRCTFCQSGESVTRHLKGAKNWSCNYHENWKVAYRHTQKNHRFQKCYSFRSTTKNDEVIVQKTLSKQWRHYRRLWTHDRLELTLVVNTCFFKFILSQLWMLCFCCTSIMKLV